MRIFLILDNWKYPFKGNLIKFKGKSGHSELASFIIKKYTGVKDKNIETPPQTPENWTKMGNMDSRDENFGNLWNK